MIPITLITGFLGSGKTAILRSILEDDRFGEIAAILTNKHAPVLDYYVLSPASGQRIEALSDCDSDTLHVKVRQCIFDILLSEEGRRGDFKRILVEVAGTAEPSRLIHMLSTDARVRKSAYLADIITVIDGINGRNTLNNYPVAIKQACFANRMIVTKSDLVSSQRASRGYKSIVSSLHQFNPKAPILRWPDETLDLATLFSDVAFDAARLPTLARHWFLEGGMSEKEIKATERGRIQKPEDRITSHWLTMEDSIDPASLGLFVELIKSHRSGDLLRIKGILHVLGGDQKAISFQAEQDVVHDTTIIASSSCSDRWSRIMMETKDVSTESVEDLLNILRLRPDEAQSEDFRTEARRIATINEIADGLVFNDDGVMPIIVQNDETREVLTLTWLDRESVVKVMATQRFGSNYQLTDFGRGSDGGTAILLVRVLDADRSEQSIGSSASFETRQSLRSREMVPQIS